jgi:multidrug efflux pump
LPSIYLSFKSDILSQSEVTDYLVRGVQPRLSALAGVQRAEIIGARTFAMRIWMKPDRMAALNISPVQVRSALAANNYLAAVGSTKGSLVQVNLTANTDMHSVEDFKRLIVRQQNDTIIRLEDIADVVLGAEDYDTIVRNTGHSAVFMGIFPLPNANTIDVVSRVRTELAAIQRDLPAGLTAGVGYDASEYIRNAIEEVSHTLIETLLIVVVVIFVFLGSLRSALVPVIAIPVSLIGGIFLMQLFGFTLNLLTLLAIVLSVGIVVDDAIVVVENVERHLREGRTPMEAALLGARELVGPVIAMTITLVAVYGPIGLQGGLTGTLFREFALTLAGAVAISGFVALTLSPMMASRLLESAEEEERGWSVGSTIGSTGCAPPMAEPSRACCRRGPTFTRCGWWSAFWLISCTSFRPRNSPHGGPGVHHRRHQHREQRLGGAEGSLRQGGGRRFSEHAGGRCDVPDPAAALGRSRSGG